MYEQTLKLVQTTEDLSLLRQEIEALRQSLYRTGREGDASTAPPQAAGRAPTYAKATAGRQDDKAGLKSLPALSSAKGREDGFVQALEREVRAVAAEAIKADLAESTLLRPAAAGLRTGEARSTPNSFATGQARGIATPLRQLPDQPLFFAKLKMEGTESTEGRESTTSRESIAYSQSNLQEFLEGLEQRLSRLRPMRLTLAFEPTRELIGRLSHWLRVEMRSLVVLELKVDPTILGGVQLTTFEGRFWDLSVAGKIDGILQESKTEILQYLKRKVGEPKKAS